MLGAPSRGTPTKPPPVKKWPGEGGGNLNRNPGTLGSIPQQTPQVPYANEATPGPPLFGPPRGGCGFAFGVPGHKIAGLRVAVQQKWVSRQEAAPRSRRINIRAGGAGGGCRDSKGHRAKRSTVSQVGYPSEVAESFVGHSGRGPDLFHTGRRPDGPAIAPAATPRSCVNEPFSTSSEPTRASWVVVASERSYQVSATPKEGSPAPPSIASINILRESGDGHSSAPPKNSFLAPVAGSVCRDSLADPHHPTSPSSSSSRRF